MKLPTLYQLPTANRSRRQMLLLALLGGLAAALFLSLVVAASRLARLTGYPAELGRPLGRPLTFPLRATAVTLAALAVVLAALRRQWPWLPAALLSVVATALLTAYPAYPPAPLFLARRAFTHTPYAPLLLEAEAWGGAAFLALLCAFSPAALAFARTLSRTGDLHGSARLARASDILASGFTLDDPAALLSLQPGLPVGVISGRGRKRLVRVQGDVHVLAFAPPGAGKTTCLVIPAAQDFDGNIFVLDVKGEIAAATAGYRQSRGSRILLLDPSRDDPSLIRYNPLLSIRTWPHDVQDAGEIAQLLVPLHPGGDPFWPNAARSLLEGVILHILYSAEEKTLAACHRFLCDPASPIEQQFERVLATLHDPASTFGWAHHPRVETAARAFLDMPPVTRGGVLSNAQTALSPYADPILARATAASDFALEDLYKTAERPVSLYLVIDPNQILRLADHIRIVVSQVAAALTREMPDRVARRKVLLLLDEFPVFGRMAVLERSIAFFRGYGVQCYLVVQHIGQLLAAYGPNQSISPNCSVQIAFAPADLATAEMLSKRAGSLTVHYERDSRTSQGLRSNLSVQQADSGRPLFMPDEIMRLPRGQALVLRTGTLPILVTPRPFYDDPLRSAAARLPLPASEPTLPDYSHWLLRRASAPPSPPKGRREARSQPLASLLSPEPLR